MRLLNLLLLSVLLTACVKKETQKASTEFLRSISVTIDLPKKIGSGVVFTRKDSKGQDVTFVWTCGHVVTIDDDLLETLFECGPNDPSIIDTNGLGVVKATLSDYRGHEEMVTNEVEVIKYSGPFNGCDLAILKLKGKYINTNSVAFDFRDIPKYGEELYILGSPHCNRESITDGIVSYIGRKFNKSYEDQITGFIYPGSSGGPVFLKENGNCIGLVRATEDPGINCIIPARKMLEWARKEGVEWALNPDVPMPTDEELKKLNVFDMPVPSINLMFITNQVQIPHLFLMPLQPFPRN